MDEFEAGPGQCVVSYLSIDTGSDVPWRDFARDIAADAARRRRRRLADRVRPARSPSARSGTAGNVLFQSGGQLATQLATIVVYARAA